MREMVQLPQELLESIRRLGEEHGNRNGKASLDKPLRTAVEQRIMAFDWSDAATITSLILSAWPLLFPRSGSPKCNYVGKLSGRCGKPILHTQYNREDKELLMVCAANHEIVQRKPRVYRGG